MSLVCARSLSKTLGGGRDACDDLRRRYGGLVPGTIVSIFLSCYFASWSSQGSARGGVFVAYFAAQAAICRHKNAVVCSGYVLMRWPQQCSAVVLRCTHAVALTWRGSI